MNLQRQQRRSSEVRGCLLKNFLDMRKRSLIRSESQDSGFSLESYDPLVNSSFDAEKFLEELGFVGDNAPLIPDRFIPSLIHRISNMPDETVVKLDSRVWNSIDSFKKKEHRLWFFAQSSVECDLCIHDLQRSYSVPAEFQQGSSHFLYPGDGAYAMGSGSSAVSTVQNWLSRFAEDDCTAGGTTKANIGYIGNQSSIESGILSALSDDEAYTTANHSEGFYDSCPSKRAGDFGLRKVESLKPGMDFEGRIPEIIPNNMPPNDICHNEIISASSALYLETTPISNHQTPPSETVSVTDARNSGISPASKGERCLNSSSFLNPGGTSEEYGHYKSLGENPTGNPNEIPTKFGTKPKQGHLRKVITRENLDSVAKNLDSDSEDISLSTEKNKCRYPNVEVEDVLTDDDTSDSRFSPSKSSDVTRFDSMKKRHSFDSAYLTAAERRKRFRHSHSKTHNFLFAKEDSRLSTSHSNEMAADNAALCDLRNVDEETEIKCSNQLKPERRDDGSQYISHHNSGNVDTPSEVSDAVSDLDISNHNGYNLDTPLEVSDTVSNLDISNHNGDNLDTPLEVSDAASDLDISNHNEDNLDTPLEVSDTVSNLDISNHNGDILDTALEVSDAASDLDISNHNGDNLNTPLELSDTLSNAEQLKAAEVCSTSDCESEQYFSCDEIFNTKTPADDDFTERDGSEENKEIPTEFVNLSPAKHRVTSAKMTSQMASRDKALFRNCNRNTYAKYKEHFILNKILKRSLKFSVLCPIEKMSRHFRLENDNETFSQILNGNDPPSSLKSKVLEKQVTFQERASCGIRKEKTIERIMGDKESKSDNNLSFTSKPFVRNLSPGSDMFSPKCEVRLINYDGLTLFWAARNVAESTISCDSGFTDTTYCNFDDTVNRRCFLNGVYMDVNCGNETDSKNHKMYFSEVRLEVNSDDRERDPGKERLKRSVAARELLLEGEGGGGDDVKEKALDEEFTASKTQSNTENPCGRALKDLEDLKNAIRKAKETRVSASRELRLLQELLHNGDPEEDETISKRKVVALSESKPIYSDTGAVHEIHTRGKTIEALAELQQKSAKEASQNKEFWEEKIRKAKEEESQVCHEKISIMEEKLHTTEDELARALQENTRLKDQLELRSAAFSACKCNAEAQHSDFSHMNGISDEDPKIISVAKPSVPTKSFWQEWDRLQSDLMKAERKADELNILLNQKLIELNRMQLTLSKQTKEMILLEKAYFQLRSHLSKRKLSKSALSQQSSLATKTERTSEISSKATDPEIPP